MRDFTLYCNMWMDKQSIISGLSAQISVRFDVYWKAGLGLGLGLGLGNVGMTLQG